MNAKATMETHPCGHRVICRKCFIKTIQVAVAQRCLPLKCVICRTRILKLRQPAYIKVSSSMLQKLRWSDGHSKSPKPARIYAK
ncbi:hypothetical protein CHS0354_015668 [Potamilus streckersoni]|uniref:RING-type domain-containing protein n=1 Tax=Potamilus streckersoni TaxID=2493646 RepID=A0AAE0SS28_9BIVA|nr:hypothetical protein CHS0354_015668 [Potamilus streckersoni]